MATKKMSEKEITMERNNMSVHLKEFQQEVEARLKPINTLLLQVESLEAFAEAIGYRRKSLLAGFYNKRNRNYISFQEMCDWHNNCLTKKFSHTMTPLLRKASTSRLVEKVKLQRKKGGNIVVQSNEVKLVTSSPAHYKAANIMSEISSLSFEQVLELHEKGFLK